MIWRQSDGSLAPQEMVEMCQRAAEEFGVPAGVLLGTIERESNFRMGLESRAGAVGPCQFLRRFEADYHRYAGFAFDLAGMESIRGLAAVYKTYARWGEQRHGYIGEDGWRFALAAHRWGQNSAQAVQLTRKGRIEDVEKAMRRNGVWYDTAWNGTAKSAALWALGKVGCRYSQSKRLQEGHFDCSSLAARAYAAQGMDWALVGHEVPLSYEEVYSDQFELIWPESYEKIGKTFGGREVIRKAQQAGDLQFLCTNKKTSRKNRITHVAMATGQGLIVHARSEKYGVRVDDGELYSGKVCALTRYAPNAPLRKGMRGARVKALQEQLNAGGASLEADGIYGKKTEEAVKTFRKEEKG